MTRLNPKQHAQVGMLHLEKSVLDVLLEAKHKNECLGPAEISRRAGIFRARGTENIINDAITTGLLVKLSSEGRVERCKQNNRRGGWEMTQQEFTSRHNNPI